MSASHPSDDEVLESLVGRVADEFTDRLNRGEAPDVEEYARRYPAIADVLREGLSPLRKLGQSTPRGPAAEPLGGNPPLPERLGDYRIVREVGRGGMGVVYEAVQEPLGRRVALKVLPVRPWTDPSYLERFRREARAAARLHHTNIVPVFGVGEEQGVCYYAMQFIEGQGLEEVIRHLQELRDGKPADPRGPASSCPWTGSITRRLLTGEEPSPQGGRTPDSAAAGMPDTPRPGTPAPKPWQTSAYYRGVARIGWQAAQALAYAHSQGVLHRDVKPANLLLDAQGTVWLTDFGLAKAEGLDDLTHTGDVVGTLRYLAPERLSRAADARSDVYGLGLTLYEMLTLRPAFDDTDRHQLVKQLTQEEPPRPRRRDRRIPRDLETIVVKAMAKEPAGRYVSGTELAEDLRRFLEGRPIAARRLPPWEQAWRWCRRRPAVAGLLLVSVALVFSLLAVSLVYNIRLEKVLGTARHERDRAETYAGEARAAVHKYYTKVSDDPRLQTAGLHELRKELLAEAAAFYRQFVAQGPGEPELQDELALSYMRLARITAETESVDRGIAIYLQAWDHFEERAREQPTAPQPRIALLRIAYDLGLFHAELNQIEEAAAAFRQARDLGEELVRKGAGAAKVRANLGLAYAGLGAQDARSGRAAEAAANRKRALDVWEELVRENPRDPDLRYFLALGYRDLARSAGEAALAPAEQFNRRALELVEPLPPSQGLGADVPRFRAGVYRALGRLYRKHGRAAEAEAPLRTSRDLLQSLVKSYPVVQVYRQELAESLYVLAGVWLNAGRMEEAVPAFEEALTLQKALVQLQPDHDRYLEDLASTCDTLGTIYTRAGQTDRAIAVYRQALAAAEPRVRARPDDVLAATRVGGVLVNLGHALRDRRDQQAALESYDRGIATLEAVCRRDPQEKRASDFLCNGYHGRAATLAALNRRPVAGQDLDRLVALALGPTGVVYTVAAGALYSNLGNRAHEEAKWQEAVGWYERAARTLRSALERNPAAANGRAFLRNALHGRGLTLARMDRPTEGLADLDEALRMDDGTMRIALRIDRAFTLALAGDHGGATAAVGDLVARGAGGSMCWHVARVYARAAAAARRAAKLAPDERERLADRYGARAVELLTQARQDAFFKTAQHRTWLQRSADLDPLRQRPDFRKLQADVEAAAKADTPR
jgi:serine/threonine-protein kinase